LVCCGLVCLSKIGFTPVVAFGGSTLRSSVFGPLDGCVNAFRYTGGLFSARDVEEVVAKSERPGGYFDAIYRLKDGRIGYLIYIKSPEGWKWGMARTTGDLETMVRKLPPQTQKALGI
jgi:hypothetical protein